MTERTVRAVAASPIPGELADRIRSAEPRLDLVVPTDLLPPMRHPGDHTGDPSFQRSGRQEQRYQDLLLSSEVIFGVPQGMPERLGDVVRGNARLQWVQLTAAGGGAQVAGARLTVEELDRVRFTTTAGVHAVPLAEWAEFGLLAGLKGLPRLQRQQRRHEWVESRWIMRRLEDSRILIVGLGSIGRLLAERLARQGATVSGTSRRPVHVAGVSEVIHPRDLRSRVGEFDGVVVTLPGTAETRQLIGAEVIAAMRADAVVVNVGRGSVIDQDALIGRLQTGQLFAALDVTEPEPLPADSTLWDLTNVLISPHTAALSEKEDALIADLFAKNATRYLDGLSLINTVNRNEFY